MNCPSLNNVHGTREKFSMTGFLTPTVYESVRFSALLGAEASESRASNPFVVTGLQKRYVLCDLVSRSSQQATR